MFFFFLASLHDETSVRFTSQPLNATCDASPWLSHGAKQATTYNLLSCGLIIIKEEAGFTRLHQARHSGHGWAVSGGSAEVGGAAGPLPAAFMGRLHAATEKTETEKNWFGFCFGKQRLQTKPGLAQAWAPHTWHQRCAPCMGHPCGIDPSSWSPSSHPPLHPAAGPCYDTRPCIPPSE